MHCNVNSNADADADGRRHGHGNRDGDGHGVNFNSIVSPLGVLPAEPRAVADWSSRLQARVAPEEDQELERAEQVRNIGIP